MDLIVPKKIWMLHKFGEINMNVNLNKNNVLGCEFIGVFLAFLVY